MIITNIHFLQQYIDIANDFRVDRLGAFEDDGRSELGNYINSGLVEIILGFHAETSGEKFMMYQEFLKAFVPFTFHHFIDFGEVTIGELGIMRHESEHAKTAYAQQVLRIKHALFDKALGAVDRLIAIIDATTLADVKSEWQKSPAYFNRTELLIPTATDFNHIIPLYRKELTFVSLISHQRTTLDVILPQHLGLDWRNIIGAITDQSSDELKNGLKYLKVAVANMTLMQSIQHKILKVTPEGLLTTGKKGSESDDTSSAIVSLDVASSFYRKLDQDFNSYISLAKKILIPTPTDEYSPKRFFA